jgi:surface protein
MTIADQLTSINNSKQAIKTAIEAKGVTVGTAAFDQYATKISEISGSSPVPTPALWTRNPSWLALPTVTDTENKFVGLHAIDRESNFLALSVTKSTSGFYQVNWGDGNIQLYSNGTQANKQYNWADIPDSTRGAVTFTASTDLVSKTSHGYTNGMSITFNEITGTTGINVDTSYYVIAATTDTFQLSLTLGGSAIDLVNDGSGYILPYKQVIVTITPDGGGNLTLVNLNIKHNQSGLQTYTSGWLDCVLSAPSLTTLTIGAVLPNVRHGNLEQFSLLKSNLTNLNSLFQNCTELRSVPTFIPAATGNLTGANMFQSCINLTHLPESFTTFSSRITTLDTAFRDCYSLAVVPDLDLSAVTNLNSAFSDCYALVTTGTITTTTALLQCQNMFFQCRALTTAPLFNTQSVTQFGAMFNNCSSLTTVPLYNTASAQSFAQWFQNCSVLTSVPLFNTASVTNMSNMFSSCFILESVPLFNTSAVTNMNGMFIACRSLKTIPAFDVSAVTNVGNMFQNCNSLESIPSLNFDASLITASGFVQNCTMLRSIGTMNFNGVTNSANLSNAFGTCPNLSKIGVTGAKFTHSIGSCKLSAAELNNYYTNLPSVTGQTLTVSGNWGVATDTISIAGAKGWTISG